MRTGGALVLHWCDDCAGIRAFEAPPCSDGHAPCPELACLECGAAVVLAVLADPSGRDLDAVPGAADTSWALPRSA